MAQLTPAEQAPWGSAQTRAQYAAIVQLRWRMFLNGFRRKGSKGDMLSYFFTVPLFLAILGGTSFGAASGAYALTASEHVAELSWVFWGIFVVSQLININLGQPGTTFDPTQLIRFPLGLASYTAIRLFFGVLSPGNILVVILSLAAAIGVIFAQPSLWAYALIASALFAVANILFTRMVFTWVDRWLSTRRAREVFTGLIFLASIGFQYWNVTYNMGSHHRHHHHRAASTAETDATDDDASDAATEARVEKARARYSLAKPYLDVLPPALTGSSIAAASRHHPLTFAVRSASTLGWAGLFLAIFALRMKTEFRGENLSDQANAVPRMKPVKSSTTAVSSRPVAAHAHLESPTSLQPSALQSTKSTVSAVLGKEFLYVRRNTGLFYGLIAPLVFVCLFAGRLATRSNSQWIFPAALAYALLGVVPVSFNSFGLDGTGAQFFFLAPVRLRDVLLAKNLLNFLIAIFEVVAVTGIITYMTGLPQVSILLSTFLWVLMTFFVEVTVGNYQSIRAPKRIDPGRTAQKQARPLSAFISIGILLAAAAVGWSVLALASTFSLMWLAPLVLLALTLVAAYIYWHNLEGMDVYALRHRDNLFEELGKKA